MSCLSFLCTSTQGTLKAFSSKDTLEYQVVQQYKERLETAGRFHHFASKELQVDLEKVELA